MCSLACVSLDMETIDNTPSVLKKKKRTKGEAHTTMIDSTFSTTTMKSTTTAKRSAGSAAVFDALNSQVKEREAERLAKIQQQRAAELASLRGRSAITSMESPGITTTTSKENTAGLHQQRLQDISRVVEGKSSIVAAMKTTLDVDGGSNKSPALVFDLNDFYMKQRSEGIKSHQQKEEATNYLHRRGTSSTTSATPVVPPTQDNATTADSSTTTGTQGELPQAAQVYFRSVAEASASESTSAFNFSKTDYRAFLFIFHQDFGLLLLHCTRKRKKGPHFQLPGGHVDEAEFIAASRKNFGNPKVHLAYAAKRAAARELFEETGLDFRDQLDRIEPAHLKEYPSKPNLLTFEYKHRIFFQLSVTDNDFFQNKSEAPLSKEYTMPLCYGGSYLFLKLSHEHSGFTFEKDLKTAASLLKHHSGGHCTEALNLYQDFLTLGKKPEPIETPCEWLEQELLLQQQEQQQQLQAQQAAAGEEKQKKKKKDGVVRTEKSAPQQKPKNGSGFSDTVTAAAVASGNKYQEQYMKKEVPRTRNNLEVKMEDTPRTQVSDDCHSSTQQYPADPSSWSCCWCFRNRAKARVASSLSSASESTALLKH